MNDPMEKTELVLREQRWDTRSLPFFILQIDELLQYNIGKTICRK